MHLLNRNLNLTELPVWKNNLYISTLVPEFKTKHPSENLQPGPEL